MTYSKTLDTFAMIKYVFLYVTISQKGMSVIVKCTCREVKNGNMDLKASLRHTGYASLNGEETDQEEVAGFILSTYN